MVIASWTLVWLKLYAQALTNAPFMGTTYNSIVDEIQLTYQNETFVTR